MTAIPLSGARVLLVIGGGIAAYKSLELIRRLRIAGRIRARRDDGGRAKDFITPLSVATLSGEAVREDLFSLTDESLIGHIELSRAADLVVVAPATANLLARMAGGLADDLATTLLLATDKRTLVAPAMNVQDVASSRDAAQCRAPEADGVLFVGPDDGTDGVRRVRSRAHGRAAGDHRRRSRGACRGGKLADSRSGDSGSVGGTARHRHVGPDL